LTKPGKPSLIEAKKERRKDMDFGGLFKTSLDQLIKGIVKIILFFLVGVLLSVTIVLIPTVMGGFIRGFLKYIREGKEPEFNELWSFENYWQILLSMVVPGLLTLIGFICLIVPGLQLTIWWMYSPYFVVDKNMGFWEAMKASRAATISSGTAKGLVLLIILVVLLIIGNLTFGVGLLVTMPFGALMVTNAYLIITGETAKGGATQPGAKTA
jgi:hypothetical protein